jgi:GntR family transcriptional regulator, transcriptional repressor for pyruvate dehydrogenase complex
MAAELPSADPKTPSVPTKFERIRPSRAFDEIAGQIREELAAGRLRVGNRLPSERALAEQFGVSRNTLREALRSLEHAGLIRLQKGARGGAFISERSGEAITVGLMDMYHLGSVQPAELTEARIWLESVIVREACHRATPAGIDALYRNIEQVQAAIDAGDFEMRAKKHIEFHRILATMTGNPIMVIVMNAVLDVLRHFIGKIGDYENAFVLPSRRRFIKHLIDRDANAAVAEMEACLKRLQRSYLSRIEPPAKEKKKAAAVVQRKSRKTSR